jgi:CRISPR-associated protein Cas5h
MDVIVFEYSARFGHFLRAEAGVSGITYPLPPRTALLGLFGAVLGMEKDEPQTHLAETSVAVGGPSPRRFWHRVNVRKDPPNPLPLVFKITVGRGPKKEGEGKDTKPEKNCRLSQEWLWQPRYRVWASLPAPHHDAFADRLIKKRWFYCPCMGLSELSADLGLVGRFEGLPLEASVHAVHSVARQESGVIEVGEACRLGLAIQNLRMPRAVNPDRVFEHAGYLVERDGRPIPVSTGQAWRVGEEAVIFL